MKKKYTVDDSQLMLAFVTAFTSGLAIGAGVMYLFFKSVIGC